MHPEIARTLAEQRRAEITRSSAMAGGGRRAVGRPGWLSRHVPRWHVSWSRTILSPATGPAASDRPGRLRRGSSVVIIISAHR
jgi:hypothetical protein